MDKKVSSRKPFKFSTDFKDYKKTEFKDSVKIYANNEVGYVAKSKIGLNIGWVDKYKVLISKAYGAGSGYPHQILGKPILVDKNTCCTETYLVVDVFDNKKNAENLEKYMKTRFFRFLVSLKKNTQDNPKNVFSFVPDLDMSQEWTDEKLYKRYEIDREEQNFIKSIVKEMA